MGRARDQAEQTDSDINGRCEFAKHLVRTEPCARSYSYRRKVKRSGSRARRRIDRAIITEELT